ncbi:LuxR C-terminal-related transcriptional regulator [Vibrio sinaloensis]|uniref:LuxR C-terminal-related transcriptional regulator n=1 Tax=Photobacterium sp. (strain ATCC 43367) TaxID=379097 RepID=UPI0022AFF5BE|nr:LuxR C-terminal-related transcriptional regulator [Vibrio sinaloensis]MCZ4295692.1 LuxR C-terminal-related transcriptional regulator [Vibrio sinaloensis]
MNKKIYTRTIHFLSEDVNAANPFIDKLEQQLELTIPRMQPNDLLIALQQHKHRILLIDHYAYTRLKSQIRNLPLADKSFETIIFNVTHPLSTDEVLAFGHLKGLFYQQDSIEYIAKRCKDIINGENCLPSKVCAQLLYYYRSVVDSQTAPATVDLTIRELQILRCLISGASNIQIAEDMFISEFTVKSHLQKIFKKLCVKNRAQAASWARQHMNPNS